MNKQMMNDLLNDMGFCGCNTPEKGLILIRDILNLMPLYKNNNREKLETVLISDGIGHIILSYLTNHDLIEHGGTLCGSWLTEFGENVKQYLNSIDIERFFDEY